MENDNDRILITGGAGFIGSNLVRHIINESEDTIVNVDSLTYAGNPESLADLEADSRYQFECVDITNASAVQKLFEKHQPSAVMHLAAESHVDRSIDGPGQFIQTNIVGTFNLLHSARLHWNELERESAQRFRFHHISTDEVYGTLESDSPAFTEENKYDPHSPYSASKASADHLVRAWADTYGLPVLITNCSNNYGPYQFPEKLIPVVILKALGGKAIPVYGDGKNIRDWLYVEDHARALFQVLKKGSVGETYNIGGDNEITNIDLVKIICRILDKLVPIAENDRFDPARKNEIQRYEDLIEFVKDRPGHDFRYAIDAGKIKSEIGWKPLESSESGFEKTVRWYLDNENWWSRVLSGDYQLERIGLGESS